MRSGSDVLLIDVVVFVFVMDYVKYGIVICIDLFWEWSVFCRKLLMILILLKKGRVFFVMF